MKNKIKQIINNINKQETYNKWKILLDNVSISKDKNDWFKEYSNNSNELVSTYSENNNYFPSLLPISMKVSAKTIASGYMSESEERIKKRNRILKLKRILDSETFNNVVSNDEYEEILEIKEEYHDGLLSVLPLNSPSPSLIYLDYKYKRDDEK